MVFQLLSLRTGARLGGCNSRIVHKITNRTIVTTLSDEKAVEKFRLINAKSVLYFTASWCPPCKQISPIYDKMSDEYPSIAFGKVDVDENSDAALDFEVNAVPTFVVFDGETATAKFSGADPNKLLNYVKELDAK